MKLGDNVEERSLTICSGTDYININYQHVVCPDIETAKVSGCLYMLHCLKNYLFQLVNRSNNVIIYR